MAAAGSANVWSALVSMTKTSAVCFDAVVGLSIAPVIDGVRTRRVASNKPGTNTPNTKNHDVLHFNCPPALAPCDAVAVGSQDTNTIRGLRVRKRLSVNVC